MFALTVFSVSTGLSAAAAATVPIKSCPVPNASEMRQSYENAFKRIHQNLRARVPNASFTVDWQSQAGVALLTNTVGDTRAFDLSTGETVDVSNSQGDLSEPDHSLNYSPNGSFAVGLNGYNLELLNIEEDTKRSLTEDGTSDLAYGVTADNGTAWLETRQSGVSAMPYGLWSPDSRYFATLQVDQRDLRKWPIIVSSQEQGMHQVPRVEEGRVALPGDQNVPTGKIVVFDVQLNTVVRPDVPPLLLSYGPSPIGGVRWSEDGGRLFAGVESRDYKKLDIWLIDVEPNISRRIFSEVSDLPIRPFADATLFTPVGRGDEFVLYSERDGRTHLYLVDVNEGTIERQLTSGDWSVAPGGWGSITVDSPNRIVYFTAYGREDGRDPYHQHFYRTSLDGGPITLLTPEDGDHRIHLSIQQGVFFDSWSRVDKGTTTVLRKLNGDFVTTIAEVKTEELADLGWRPPIRFTVKAADGKSDLWGTFYFPANIWGPKCHPLIDAVYGGPTTMMASAEFLGGWAMAEAASEIGFASMVLDARGTPMRDAKFRNATWGPAFGSEVFAADHEAAVKQLAARYDFINPNRVGIYGHSWGGYYTVRAMAQRPDTFKVGVASAGSHDNFLYSYEHDRWFGSKQDFPETYNTQSNFPIAKNIEGKLLLAHGDSDDDVHVLNSILMAGAMAKANRPVDMLILPGLNHSTLTTDAYFIRARWDYFVEHLMGWPLPREVRITD